MVFAQILTIEDDAAIRQAIVDALEFAGYSVIQPAGGDDGLDLALHASYDLLLLDLVLPHVSGLEILRQLRAARASQPVIVLTAKGDENDRVEGLKLGADDYVVKPFVGYRSRPGDRCFIVQTIVPAFLKIRRGSGPFLPWSRFGLGTFSPAGPSTWRKANLGSHTTGSDLQAISSANLTAANWDSEPNCRTHRNLAL